MKKSLCKIFGKNLQKLRKAKGLTQLQFAEISKIQRATIGKYETGERAPTIDHLLYFSEFFNVPTDYILGISTVDKYNMETNSICNFTGLTKENIEFLNSLNELKKARKKITNDNEDNSIEYIDILSSLLDNINEIPSVIFNIINAASVNENKGNNSDFDLADELTVDIQERFSELNNSDFKVLTGYNYKLFIMQQIKSDFDVIINKIVNRFTPKEYLNEKSDFNTNLNVFMDPPYSLEGLANAQTIGLSKYEEVNKNAQHNPKEE